MLGVHNYARFEHTLSTHKELWRMTENDIIMSLGDNGRKLGRETDRQADR